MTWKQLTERDCREWKLSAVGTLIISAMHAVRQLRGRGPTDVDVISVPAC